MITHGSFHALVDQDAATEMLLEWMAAHAFAGALLLGTLYGTLVAIAPDHLGTIITLAIASDDIEAMRVGTVWGLTHSAGMGVIVLCLSGLERAVGLSLDGFGTYSEYAVGLSLILCSLYFILKESQYIKENDDGTQTILSCDCCSKSAPKPTRQVPIEATSSSSAPAPPGMDLGLPPPPPQSEGHPVRSSKRSLGRPQKRKGVAFCEPFVGKEGEGCCCSEGGDPEACLKAAPKSADPESRSEVATWDSRDVNGAVMGTIQGLCCPMTLAGTTFAGMLDTPQLYAAFGVAFVVSSCAVTAGIALLWSRLFRTGSAWLAPKPIYRITCAANLLLGIVWVVANAAGTLERLDWTDHLFRQDS